MTRVRASLAAALAAGLISAPLAAGAGPARSSAGCATAGAFRAGPLGAVAYLRAHRLHVVDLASGRDRALATVAPQPQVPYPALAWSPDGHWITVGSTLVAAATGATCRPFGRAAYNLQWRPRTHTLIASTPAGRVLIGGPDTAPRPLLPPGFAAGGVSAFDPPGRRLVAEGPEASLWIMNLETAKRTRIWQSPAPYGRIGPPTGERWSPDGRWILFQTDTYHSQSIAADGLPLWAIPAAGGHATEIERELLRASDFVQPCAGEGVVISAGFDREVSARKRIDLAAPPAWKPHTISNDTRRSWYAAACSPDGRLVAATVTRNGDEGRFDSSERTIWLLASNGSTRRLLVGRPGDGVSDEQPRWSRDGAWILYLQHSARPYPSARLYLVNAKTGERRGPYARIDGGLGYYGYHDWSDLAAWYQAA